MGFSARFSARLAFRLGVKDASSCTFGTQLCPGVQDGGRSPTTDRGGNGLWGTAAQNRGGHRGRYIRTHRKTQRGTQKTREPEREEKTGRGREGKRGGVRAETRDSDKRRDIHVTQGERASHGHNAHGAGRRRARWGGEEREVGVRRPYGCTA